MNSVTVMVDWFKDLCYKWSAEAFKKCPRCFALVEKDDEHDHLAWHANNGDLGS